MVDSSVTATLALFHIFSAIGWLGAALFFTTVVGPVLPRLSPPARSELILKMFHRQATYIEIFSGLTVVFGVGLALARSDGDLSIFLPTSSWGLRITAGATIALIAFVIAFAIVIPGVKNLIKMVEQMQQNPQQPPPAEFFGVQKRIRYGAMAVLILLIIVLVFMVGAVRYY